jgi:hypothetical protein
MSNFFSVPSVKWKEFPAEAVIEKLDIHVEGKITNPLTNDSPLNETSPNNFSIDGICHHCTYDEWMSISNEKRITLISELRNAKSGDVCPIYMYLKNDKLYVDANIPVAESSEGFKRILKDVEMYMEKQHKYK